MSKVRGRPKSQEKLAQIMDSAIALFLSEGYERSSMQRIAENAGVSKQTLYSHFDNKEDLFRNCLTQKATSNALQYEKFQDEELIEGLRDMSLNYLSIISEPEVVRMWRLMVASAEKLPNLSMMFFEQGPAETRAVFARFMTRFADQLNTTEIDDAARAYLSILAAGRAHQLLLGLPVDTSKAKNLKQVNKSIEMFQTLFMK